MDIHWKMCVVKIKKNLYFSSNRSPDFKRSVPFKLYVPMWVSIQCHSAIDHPFIHSWFCHAEKPCIIYHPGFLRPPLLLSFWHAAELRNIWWSTPKPPVPFFYTPSPRMWSITLTGLPRPVSWSVSYCWPVIEQLEQTKTVNPYQYVEEM